MGTGQTNRIIKKEIRMKHPDPKLHLQLSIVKSGIRILAGGALVFGSIWYAGVGLIVAELIGIAEELV